MTRTTQAPVRRRRIGAGSARILAPLLLSGALAACGSQTIRFDPGVRETVAGFDASELRRFDVYYQDNYWNGPSPSAVVLDVDDGVAFEGERWSRAQSGSEARLVSRALDAGLMATELRDADGNLLGYLVATERWYDRRRNRYRMVVAQAGGSYDVLTSEHTHETGGAR